MANATFQEWSLSGRNRRLADSTKPYTIYARLPKADKSNGYLVFAAKNGSAASGWTDKYNYVTPTGISNIAGAANSDVNWYIRMGDVSLPESGLRTVDLDTGILGTDQYNNEWSIGTALLPQRVDLSCQVAGKTLGATPYIFWGETLTLSARLIEGWNTDVSTRVRRWSIERNTGNATADAAWNAIDRSGLGGFGTTGIINLAHLHDNDDFAGCPATVFTVTAWGEADGQESELTEIDTASVTVLAESAAAQANARIQTADRGAWSSSPTAVYMGSAGTYTPDGTLPEGSPYSRAVTVVDGQSVSDPYHFRTISYVTWLQYRLNNTYSGMTDRELMQQILTLLQGNVDLEVSRVWRGGKMWECLVDGTTQQPRLGSQHWQVVSGDTTFYGAIYTGNGRTFRNGNIDTILTMRMWWGEEEVTDMVLADHGYDITWQRFTGYDPVTEEYTQQSEDLSWIPTSAGQNKIHLQRGDMGSGWMRTYRSAMIRGTVTAGIINGTVNEVPADFIF